MALPYFYINQPATTGNILLPEETSKHCIQVLRMKAGDHLLLTDGRGNLLTTTITNADKRSCLVSVQQTKYQPQPPRKISIAISLLKNTSRFEWFLEKATEVGVTEIIPLLCQRTERQGFRHERMNNIVIAAMLQSQQCWLPVLMEPQPFDQAVAAVSYTQKLIAHCEEADKKSIASIEAGKYSQIFIGPEGDFTQDEIKLAALHDFQQVTLGVTRLRTETAGIAAAILLANKI